MSDEKGEGRYKWYVLGMLTLVYVFNFIDRQLLVILAEPIKEEFDLTDTHLGWLTGFSFAIFYVTLGIPIARYADKNNRKNVVALSLAIWSGMTALSGQVQNFTQLFLARIGVGVGEAGGSPPAHSIISDYFPPRKRATALAIYSTGIYIGILIGYTLGAYLEKLYGWRVAFLAIGIPGIVFAFLIYATIKEPQKGALDKNHKDGEDVPLKEVISLLFAKKTFLYLAIASGFNAFVTYGVGNFLPSFLIRVHSVDLVTIGVVLGLATGVGGAVGTYFGGFFADRMGKKDKRWYLWVALLGGALNIIPSLIMIFTTHAKLAMTMMFFTSMTTAFYMGPMLAVTHSLVNAKMRSIASAVFFFVLNLIGLGFGPLVVGKISTLLEPTYGHLSLRWAFLFTLIPGILSMIFYYLASTHYRRELMAFEDLQGPV